MWPAAPWPTSPARLREVLDQVVVLARYACDLEDELDRYRAAMLQLQRRLDAALAEPS